MKIEHQVCSLELAKKLKELNVTQESLFLHFASKEESKFWYITTSERVLDCEVRYAAFTAAELGEMLPEQIKMHRTFGSHAISIRNDGNYEYWEVEHYHIHLIAATQAEALATLLVKLIEAGYLLIEEVNHRLERA